VVGRLKRQSPVGLQVHEDLSKPAILVVRAGQLGHHRKAGVQTKQKVTDFVEETARTVIKGYRYNGFHEFVLKDQRGLALRSWAL